jgi:predicted RNA-binding Zn-ribbon protein involved in translation (DUF1610 family)
MNYSTPLSEIPWTVSNNINTTICPSCGVEFSRIKSMEWIGSHLHTVHADCPNCGPINRDPKWNAYNEFYDAWLAAHKNDFER